MMKVIFLLNILLALATHIQACYKFCLPFEWKNAPKIRWNQPTINPQNGYYCYFFCVATDTKNSRPTSAALISPALPLDSQKHPKTRSAAFLNSQSFLNPASYSSYGSARPMTDFDYDESNFIWFPDSPANSFVGNGDLFLGRGWYSPSSPANNLLFYPRRHQYRRGMRRDNFSKTKRQRLVKPTQFLFR